MKIRVTNNYRKSGFTIAELLIVVAIIGVLVAVSIPFFRGQLRKAKIATVRANIRAAKAAAYSELLNKGFTNSGDTHGYYIYTVSDGTIKLYESLSGKNFVTSFKGYDNPDSKKYIYKYIYVYLKTANTSDEEKINAGDIQTCPYYNSAQDEIVYNLGKAYGTGN